MKNTSERFFVVVPPGFENLCAAELAQLTPAPLRISRGGVEFTGKLRELYLANLWLRCASRILVRLDSIKCRDFPTMFHKAARLPWGRFIRAQRPLSISVSCHSSRLNHSDRIAATIADAIHKALGTTAASVDSAVLPQTIFVRLDDDLCTISIDSSGELLHKRGYRQQTTRAPLRETLAAGCLLHGNWHGNQPLWDPFCGSGTFPIEAALIAAHIPPGLQRDFAFMHWPGYRHGLWASIISEANQTRKMATATIAGSDIDEKTVASARNNAQRATVAELINFSCADALNSQPSTEHGMLICNPPYGERLKLSHSPARLFTQLQTQLASHYPQWSGFALLPQNANITSRATLKFSNGGLDVALYPINRPHRLLGTEATTDVTDATDTTEGKSQHDLVII